jgi:hypothetical protein
MEAGGQGGQGGKGARRNLTILTVWIRFKILNEII